MLVLELNQTGAWKRKSGREMLPETIAKKKKKNPENEATVF